MALRVGELVGVLRVDDQMEEGTRRALNEAERRFGRGGQEAGDRFVREADGAVRDRVPDQFREAGDRAGRVFGSSLSDWLNPVPRDFGEAGDDAGRRFAGEAAAGADGARDDFADAGREAGAAFGDEAGDAAEGGSSGGGFMGKVTGFLGRAGTVVAGAATAAGAAVGAAWVKGFSDAVDDESGDDLIAARLGLDEDQAAIAGEAAARAYSNNFGENLDHARDAVDAIWSTLRDDFGGVDVSTDADALTRATEQALALATVLGVDVGEAVSTAGTAIQSGLANNATEAFDLMTRAAQRMPSEMRAELLPAIDEYGTFLATLGITGPEAFRLLADASRDGMYGIDKTGDALKELTIRATDMSSASTEAYEAAGLGAEDMAARFSAGGDTARGALDDLVEGLLAIEDPVARQNEAIKLFGTPLEDLNVTQIPDFLRSLQDMGGGMEDAAGATDRAAATMGDNVAGRFETMKRKVLLKLQEWGAAALPVAERALDGITDVYGRLSDAWAEDGLSGVTDQLGAMWDEAWPVVEEKLGDLFERARDWLAEEGPGYLRLGGDAVERLWDWVQDAYPAMVRAYGRLLGAVATWMSEEGFPALGEWLTETGGPALWQWIQDVYPSVMRALADLWTEIGIWLVETGIPWMQEKGAELGAALLEWFVTDAAPALLRALADANEAIATWVTDTAIPDLKAKGEEWFGKLKEAAEAKGDELLEWAGGLPDLVKDKIGDLAGVLLQAGKDLIGGLIDGIEDAVPGLEDVLGGVTSVIPDWKGPPDRDRVLLRPAGRLVLGGFIDGIRDQVPDLRRHLAAITAGIGIDVDGRLAATGGAARVGWGATAGVDYERLARAVAGQVAARPIEVPVSIDGREVARATYRPLTRIARSDRRGAA